MAQGMEPGTGWETGEMPTRGLFEADYITEKNCGDLRIRCGIARRLLMPGVGRWRCMPADQLLCSDEGPLHETGEIELEDGVHPLIDDTPEEEGGEYVVGDDGTLEPVPAGVTVARWGAASS